MPSIPDFRNPSWHRSRSNAELMISILEGKNRLMPANRGVVSDSQAADLVAFVRTFDPSRKVASRSTTAPPGPTLNGPTALAATDFDSQFNLLVKQYSDLDRQLKEVSSAPLPETASKKASTEVPTSRTTMASSTSAYGTGYRLFQQTCARCHSIGGEALTGPDLKNVGSRIDRTKLVQLLLNPESLRDLRDLPGQQRETYRRLVAMPHRFKMTREGAEAVLDFIDAESRQEKSPFASQPFADRQFTASDIERGRQLFIGQMRLTSGGPSCIACHAVHGTAGREGGRLGPDLTKVYERMGSRNALTAHLWAACTPTMLPVYEKHPLGAEEVVALAAYLEQRDREGVEEAASVPLILLLWGLGGTVLGLVAVNVLFGWRFWPAVQPVLEGKPAGVMSMGSGLVPLGQGRGTEDSAVPTAETKSTQSSEESFAPGL
jgi:mono/diheme cytochrome c family protein